MYRAVRGRWDGVCEDVLAWVWLVQDPHCVRPSKSFLFRSTLTFHPENKTKRLKDVVFAPCVDVRSLKSLRTIPIPIRKSSLPCESTWSWCERWPPVRRYHHQPAVTCAVPLIAPSSVSTAFANNEADNLDECPRLKDVVHHEAELWYIHSTLCQVHDVPELSIRCPLCRRNDHLNFSM